MFDVDEYHLIPEDAKFDHVESESCWCKPLVEDRTLVDECKIIIHSELEN